MYYSNGRINLYFYLKIYHNASGNIHKEINMILISRYFLKYNISQFN